MRTTTLVIPMTIAALAIAVVGEGLRAVEPESEPEIEYDRFENETTMRLSIFLTDVRKDGGHDTFYGLVLLTSCPGDELTRSARFPIHVGINLYSETPVYHRAA